MAALDVISLAGRQALLEVMMLVAWADRELAPEEQQAASAAAVSLGLVQGTERELTENQRRPVPLSQLDVTPLNTRDREIIFVCAAWMAMADEVMQREEAQLLAELRAHFAVSESRADILRAFAQQLRERQLVERSSWWRAFDRLVVEAAKSTST